MSNKVIKDINIPLNIMNFDDLKNQKHILKDIVTSNTDIELFSRQQYTESYLEKNKAINQNYTEFIKEISLFYFAKHEKSFIKELVSVDK